MFGIGKSHDVESLRNRVRRLEDVYAAVEDDIAALRVEVASLRGKYAVSRRRSSSAEDPYKRTLEELIGGRVVSITEPSAEDEGSRDVVSGR